MTTMNAASLLPLEMSRHLHRAPHAALLSHPSLQPAGHRSPPPPGPTPNFSLCTMTASGRVSPRPRSSSTSLMAQLAADKPSASGGGGGSFLGFHSAPTAANSADNNTCRLIDYRNAQVAAFHVSQQSTDRPAHLS